MILLKLGALTLDLNRIYKPAKDPDFCTVGILKDDPSNLVSLFEMKRLKGWWPCVDVEGGDPELTVSFVCLIFLVNERGDDFI
jgi:hypothetical protein